jgi:GTP cyclohydrolase II
MIRFFCSTLTILTIIYPGGVGVVVYFRKEGRALGEVTKYVYLLKPTLVVVEFPLIRRYLVYNLRKRGSDSADKYFKSTELIAGVKDMRFQALMPDVLHWLGIKKIDNMVRYVHFPTPSTRDAR